MNEQEFSQDAKSFINNIFSDEIKQKQHNEEKEHMAPIDLTAGGLYNMDRFTTFLVPAGHRTSYNLRFRDSAESVQNMSLADAKSILHVFMNLEQITMKMINDYYGQDQLDVVAGSLIQTTMLFESLALDVIDNRDRMANTFHDVSRAPGSKRIMNHYRAKHPALQAERITINYMVQDLTQTYLYSITDSLRTDMVSMSQFTYQLALLAENVSEVLSVLNDQINQSD